MAHDASASYEQFCQANGLRIKERERQEWIKEWKELDADAVTVGRVNIPQKPSLIRRISRMVWHTVGICSVVWSIILFTFFTQPHRVRAYIAESPALYNAVIEMCQWPEKLLVIITILMLITPAFGLFYAVQTVTHIGISKR